MARVLGLDPSTVATGWALLCDDGQGEGLAASGVYAPLHSGLDAIMMESFHWLQGVVEVHDPTLLAIETPFFKVNARTMHVLSSLGAAFRVSATLAGLEVVEVAPAARCTALGLPGNASKCQVLYTVNAVYGLNLSDHNEADAVAIAAAAALRLRLDALGAQG